MTESSLETKQVSSWFNSQMVLDPSSADGFELHRVLAAVPVSPSSYGQRASALRD